jgi:putative heme-binding domain-containing protein
MEWDLGLPWYRAVRVCHCPPGADFLWRTGAANTPDYYLDSLPPLLETGRGSPVGLEFYDHVTFPKKYRGVYFMADWSLGLIYAVHLERDGATWKGKAEKFCQGAPLNVTDLGVGPDGALYFTMGGRGTQGGVYRIVYTPADKKVLVTDLAQPLAAYNRFFLDGWVAAFDKDKQGIKRLLAREAQNVKRPAVDRVKALTILQMHRWGPGADLLSGLLKDKEAEVRAHAVWLLGVNGSGEGRDALLDALKDDDALVRRRACEALIRAGIEPPVAAVWPLLGDKDRFVRTAARLVLQRIDPKGWVERLGGEKDEAIFREAVVALCKADKVAAYADQVFDRLGRGAPGEVPPLLDHLRTAQLVLLHGRPEAARVRRVAGPCAELFPHEDGRVNRELAVLLTHFGREKRLEPAAVVAKLMDALQASTGDRPQQIHYFYCLRLLPEGWTAGQKSALTAWYDGTKTWAGGHSFTPFLENIFRETLAAYGVADRKQLLASGEKTPLATLVLAQRLQNERQAELLPELKALSARLDQAAGLYRGAELRRAVGDAFVKTALRHPTPENYPYLLHGLTSPNKLVLFDVIEALQKSPLKPKADDAAPYRALLLAGRRLDEGNRWKVVELLRHWGGDKRFGAEEGDWKPELASWSKWFAQAFPKGPPLPDVAGVKPAESKYGFEDLLAFLTRGGGRSGDARRGRAVFEKAQCIKCHKYGRDGEGVGPDLTTLSKRFQRVDVLESIVYPSKVISDQYRSTTLTTKKGQTVTGLAAVQGDAVTVLQSDGTKVTLKKGDVEQQFASLVSVMPERLLDPLSKQEIADLFAFLESEPAK